jgi:DNA repair exonuclease SbcCD ATPase subunit
MIIKKINICSLIACISLLNYTHLSTASSAMTFDKFPPLITNLNNALTQATQAITNADPQALLLLLGAYKNFADFSRNVASVQQFGTLLTKIIKQANTTLGTNAQNHTELFAQLQARLDQLGGQLNKNMKASQDRSVPRAAAPTSDYRAQYQKLLKDSEVEQKNKDSYLSRIKQLEAQLNDIARLQKDNEQLNREKQALLGNLKNNEAFIAELKERMQGLHDPKDIAQIQAKAQKLIDDQQKSFEQQLKQLRDDNVRLTKENEALDEREAPQAVAHLHEQLKKAQDENKELNFQLKDATQIANVRHDESEKYKADLKNLTSERDRIGVKLLDKIKENKELREQLDNRLKNAQEQAKKAAEEIEKLNKQIGNSKAKDEQIKQLQQQIQLMASKQADAKSLEKLKFEKDQIAGELKKASSDLLKQVKDNKNLKTRLRLCAGELTATYADFRATVNRLKLLDESYRKKGNAEEVAKQLYDTLYKPFGVQQTIDEVLSYIQKQQTAIEKEYKSVLE